MRPCSESRRTLAILAGISFLILPGAHAQSPTLEVSLRQGSYLLNGDLQYTLNDEILRALEHGVGLYLITEARIYRKRRWIWNELVTAKKIRRRLEYHVLSKQYQVTHLEENRYQNYPSLDGALADIGGIRDLPLIEVRELRKQEKYTARIRSRLDLQALPPPLAPLVYVQKQWHLGSSWIEVEIE